MSSQHIAEAGSGPVTQPEKAAHFAALHVKGAPLLLYNAWDAGIGRALGFDESGEAMDLRTLYYVIRDAVRFVHRKAGTLYPKLP